MQVKNHWLTDVKRVPTKKMGGRITPKFIVMHYTAGFSYAGDLHTLAKSGAKVSCQLLVDRDGSVTQMGAFNRRMWHAGPSKSHGYSDLNSHSIGIEICNIGWLKFTNQGYRHWNGELFDPDVPIKGIGKGLAPSKWLHEKHPTAGSGMFAWEPYTDEQLLALDDITNALRDRYDTLKWVVSHEEIDTRGWKTDPGPDFPLRRYIKIIEDRSDDDSVHDDQMGTSVWNPVVPLNVRSSPEMGDNIIRVFKTEDELVVLAERGNWMLVRTADGSEVGGWVYGKYLERV